MTTATNIKSTIIDRINGDDDIVLWADERTGNASLEAWAGRVLAEAWPCTELVENEDGDLVKSIIED